MGRTTRREVFKIAAAATAGLAASGGVSASAQDRLTFCLVHGAWHGGWAWGPTVAALRAMGHEVTAPTLPGMGERRAGASAAIGLYDHTQAVADHLFMRDLRNVVLVAHSYAGCVLSDLLGTGEQRIAHAVYFDALVPGDGQSLASFVPDGPRAAMQAAAEAGNLLPVRPREAWEGLWGLTGDLADFAAARLTPQPPRTFLDPVRGDPFARAMPRTYLKARENPNPLFQSIEQTIAARGDFTMAEIAGHHDVMAIDGTLTAETLVAVASS